MNENFKLMKKILICILCLCVLLSGAFFVNSILLSQNNQAHAISVVFDGASVEDNYLYNSSFVLPKKADVKVDDAVYPATKIVLKNPNGSLSYEDVQVLDAVGNYTLQIFYQVNGETKCYEKVLVVYDNLFNVSSESSSAVFGDFNLEYSAMKNGLSVEKGIKLDLIESDIFTYRKPIKLLSEGNTEVITFAYPYDGSSKMIGTFSIKLTDVYDESKYLEFTIENYAGFGGTNTNAWLDMRAGFNGASAWGIRKGISSNRKNFKYNGEDYYIYTAAATLYNKNFVTLSYDASTNICYHQFSNSQTPTILSDLNLIDVYGKKFEGFSTNEVYLTITPTSLPSGRFLLDVLDICGENTVNNDGTNVLEYGFDSSKTYVDNEKPALKVNYTPSYMNYVYAAKNCEFPIFDVEVTDENLSNVTKEVYYNYGKADEFFVSNNGKTFLPKMVGNYTIVYKAYDTFGNVAEQLVPVICIETSNDRMFNNQFDLVSFQKEYFAGYTIKIPSFEQLKVSGINGEVSCTTKVVYMGDGSEYLPDEDGYVVLNNVGDWKIIYTLFDKVSSEDLVIDIRSLSSDKTIFDEEPIFPRYFIKGLKYDLEEFSLVTFLGSKIEVSPEVFYKYNDDAEFKSINNLQAIEDKQTIQFQYQYNGKVVYTSKAIEIVDVGYKDKELKIANYFTGDFNIEPIKSCMVFTSNKQSGNNAFDFIKEVSLSNFSLSFLNYDDLATINVNESETNANYKSFKITLFDYYNVNNKVEIKLTESKGKAIFSVGDKENIIPTSDFISIKERKIRYEKGVFYFESESIKYEVPFASDKCYVQVELGGITGESVICIKGINNQQFRILNRDTGKPQLYVSLNLQTYCVGDTFKINVPTALDVLSFVSTKNVKLTVTSPEGETVYDSLTNQELTNVVADKEYSFKFASLGRYTVSFTFKDQNNISDERTYSIYCLDKGAPTVTFKDGSDIGSGVKYKLGEEVTIKEISYFDDFDETISVIIMATDPNFNLIPITNDVFTPTEKGKYRISYRVTDTSGNSTVIYYFVVVE